MREIESVSPKSCPTLTATVIRSDYVTQSFTALYILLTITFEPTCRGTVLWYVEDTKEPRYATDISGFYTKSLVNIYNHIWF